MLRGGVPTVLSALMTFSILLRDVFLLDLLQTGQVHALRPEARLRACQLGARVPRAGVAHVAAAADQRAAAGALSTLDTKAEK